MGYKIRRVSPSALAATELCPRFRPDGQENAAAIDGTMLHEYAETMVSMPRADWKTWIDALDASNDMKWMLRSIADTYCSILLEDLPVYKDFRLRMRGGKPRKSPLKPGLYPECEVDRGQGAHGYLDLLVVTPDGLVYILDIKSSRVEHDFSRQLQAYACDVNRLCPAHDKFICRIIAPRLSDEAQPLWNWGPEDLAKFNKEIAAIEERADWSSNDDSIPGCPSDACQYCRYNGHCKYQSQVMVGVVGETLVQKQPTEDPSVAKAVDAFQSLAAGPFSGVRLTLTPQTDAERGFRRAALKAVADIFDAVKKDDAKWVEEHPGRAEVPGFKISVARGRTSLDKSRQDEFRSAVVASYGLTDQEVLRCSAIDVGMLTDYLVDVRGAGKPAAVEKDVKRIMEPFTVSGAPTVRWTASKTAGAPKALGLTGEL